MYAVSSFLWLAIYFVVWSLSLEAWKSTMLKELDQRKKDLVCMNIFIHPILFFRWQRETLPKISFEFIRVKAFTSLNGYLIVLLYELRFICKTFNKGGGLLLFHAILFLWDGGLWTAIPQFLRKWLTNSD